MNFSSLTFALTDDCNYSCLYCYQTRSKTYLDISSAKKALNFFWPYLEVECYINFYGGEPLLAFDTIHEIVRLIERRNNGQKKKVKYSITTNGSMIDDQVISFFEKNRFSVLISFDGYAQEVARQKGSFKFLVSRIQEILEHPGIALETNSVFTPDTVGLLSKSMQLIMELGVPNADVTLSNLVPWDASALSRLLEELSKLGKYALAFCQKSGTLPVNIFNKNPKRSIFGCLGGNDRMALAPDGTLWGCFLIADVLRRERYSQDYREHCFGTLDNFMKKYNRVYPRVLSHHTILRQEYFFTSKSFCAQCKEMEGCVICPMEAGLVTGIIGKIPEWTCQIRKICMRENRAFHRELKRLQAAR
jgi:sulfatase maturation enzyme AslB (radical SAM superfamily)